MLVIATEAKCTEIFRASENVYAMSCHVTILYRHPTIDTYLSFYSSQDPVKYKPCLQKFDKIKIIKF